MQVVSQARIGFQLARVWDGDRGLERTLKQRGAARRCPVCRLQTLGLTLPRRPEDLVEALELGPAATCWAAARPACPAARGDAAAAVGDLAVVAAGAAA